LNPSGRFRLHKLVCLFVCWLVCFVIAISEFLERYKNAAKAVPLLQRVPAEPPTRKGTQVQHEAQAEIDATAVQGTQTDPRD
jgi:Na+-transporting methylmalonyl-CoA/oxaloacetate decarboxylase gamma subunit